MKRTRDARLRDMVRNQPAFYAVGQTIRATKNFMRLLARDRGSIDKITQKLIRGCPPILLDYAHRTDPRYGHGKPPHAKLYDMIQAGRTRYHANLDEILALKESLLAIPVGDAEARSEGPGTPSWRQNPYYLPALDAAALYAMVVLNSPKRYVEIGSGNSTLFARRAITDHGLPTRITSVDPEPRRDVDAVCDRVVRENVEDMDMAFFETLEPGDILFIDCSHRCLPNYDVTALFLDVLPNLPPGVLVQVHDVFLPYDYSPRFADHYYTEQYLLAVYLLASDGRHEVLLPNEFITQDPELSQVLVPLWDHWSGQGVDTSGQSFWFQTVGPDASSPGLSGHGT